MKWIIQNNLWNEAGYSRFISALDKFNQDYQIVQIVPFTMIILDANVDCRNIELSEDDSIKISSDDDKIICMGGTSFTRIARYNEFNPGVYNDDVNFNYMTHIEQYGDWDMLNNDVLIKPLCELPTTIKQSMFIRPILDNKAITGTVMSPYDYEKFRNQVLLHEPDEGLVVALNKDTMMMISTPKQILAEFRIFVVDGNIITGSQYKISTHVIYNETYSPDVDEYVSRMINKWSPAKAYVMDIALTNNHEYKIIEINTINSSGFYNADVDKIVMALIDLESTS